jgi:hypothetical protein
MPPKITIPPSRLPSKVARPLLPAVLQDVLFLSYQVGEFRLCETSRNIEKKIYGRQPCWEQLYATMLSKWEKKADLEWEDLIPATAAKRALAKCKFSCVV